MNLEKGIFCQNDNTFHHMWQMLLLLHKLRNISRSGHGHPHKVHGRAYVVVKLPFLLPPLLHGLHDAETLSRSRPHIHIHNYHALHFHTCFLVHISDALHNEWRVPFSKLHVLSSSVALLGVM
jgi:hypothetical protein